MMQGQVQKSFLGRAERNLELLLVPRRVILQWEVTKPKTFLSQFLSPHYCKEVNSENLGPGAGNMSEWFKNKGL